jgi:hypothetical protein
MYVMTRKHCLRSGLFLSAAAFLVAGCTGTANATREGAAANASPTPYPYASPTPSGDAVDRARAGAETAGEKF